MEDKEKKRFLSGLFSKISIPFISESIRNKLIFWMLVMGLIPLVILGSIAYFYTYTALSRNAEEALINAQTAKVASIQNYFQNRLSDMSTLRESVKALRSNAFNNLEALIRLKKVAIENYFIERITNIEVLAGDPTIAEMLLAFEANPGPIQGRGWKEIDEKYGDILLRFSETYGYYDAYLVTSDGLLVYSVAQESDLGQNLITGELRDSPIGKAFRGGLSQLTFQDFEEYAPADGEPAAFIAAPIIVNGQARGVVMVQVSVDQINFVMQDNRGLGRTGETYLVGPDRLFRSDSIHVEESTILNPAYMVETRAITEALSGNYGQGIITNYRGVDMLTAWAPVKVKDRVWAMVAEIDLTEAFVPQLRGEEKDYFTKLKDEYGYADLMLMSHSGKVFYSVGQGKDLDTDLLTGEYKDTNLGQLVRQVMKTKTIGKSDYALYPAADNVPSAFYAVPILEKDQVELVVIARLGTKLIDEVMKAYRGELKTVDSYLVGPDYLMRSNSRLVKKSTVLNKKFRVSTAAVQSALRGNSGTDTIPSFRNPEKQVFAAWTPLVYVEPNDTNKKGIIWAVVSEVETDEIYKPIRDMTLYGVILVLITIVMVTLGAYLLSKGLTTQVDAIMDLFADIGMGNFTSRVPVLTKDELGDMAFSLNAMLDNTLSLIQTGEERDAMQASVMRLLTEISGLAEGDLTARAEVTEDFTGAIADSFNEMAEQLGRVVRNVKDVTLQVSATAQEVSTSTENLAETSEMQAVQVSDAIAAINEMAASIQQVAENATQCANVSENATQHAKEGAASVQDTNAAMETIREHVQETARAIKRLGESSQEVGNIVQLINDIADRTSILALNASIQAAMAGDAGRGFAVVAEEVQRLAERSTNATKQIDTLIKNIQGEINEAGSSMEESIQRVVEGSKLADAAHSKLQEIDAVTTELGELIQSISMAAKQQARASENIAKTMEEVGEISSQTSAASRQTAVSMKNLADISDQLNESVSVFKLGEEDQESDATMARSQTYEKLHQEQDAGDAPLEKESEIV